MANQPQEHTNVVEVVQYIDEDEYNGDPSAYEHELVQVSEQRVKVPKKSHTRVAAYEVGIGLPPPDFFSRQEKASYREQCLCLPTIEVPVVPISSTSKALQATTGPSFYNKPQGTVSSKRISIINTSLGLPEDEFDEEEIIEEIIEEEIIEEEVIEEEIIEYVDDEYDEWDYEEVEITEEEAKEQQQLDKEIATIERQMLEAKEKREAEGGMEESIREKAERMAQDSRLQECKQMKEKLTFKQKAAARAKLLAEKEKNWGKKGKKKQKDLSEIIAAKAKKQKKLLSRQKSRDYTKANTPAPRVPMPKPKPKPVENPKEEAPPPVAAESKKPLSLTDMLLKKQERGANGMPMAAVEATESKKPLSLSDMLAKKQERGINGMPMAKAKAVPAHNLRAPDDFGDEDLRAEDFLPSDDSEEEEEEEEEKVLSPEEEYKKRLEWQKPTWTQAKLKTTVKGNKIKQGKAISAPITFIPKKINEGLEDEDEEDKPSAGALMKGAIAMVQLPKVKKHHANLKFTGNGARIRDGRKIEKQINPKVKNKEEVKIWGADPDELKLTPRGLTARKGKRLEEDNIAQATQNKKYEFEKPAWAKTKPSHLLKATETGEHLKEGEDIAPKITSATEEKLYEFEKPSWTKATLKSTVSGERLKSGEYLSKPIVDLGKKSMNVNMEANPAFLRMTEQGEKLLEGEDIAPPITQMPDIVKQKQKTRYMD